MHFKSKKDSIFLVLIWGTILFSVLIILFDADPFRWKSITVGSVIGFIIMGIVIVLLLWLWFATGYRVEKNDIYITSGPFRGKIKIEEIKKIKKVKNALSSAALSIDRLEIIYGHYDFVYVSPENEIEFIQLLMSINPHIQIDEKLSHRLKREEKDLN